MWDQGFILEKEVNRRTRSKRPRAMCGHVFTRNTSRSFWAIKQVFTQNDWCQGNRAFHRHKSAPISLEFERKPYVTSTQCLLNSEIRKILESWNRALSSTKSYVLPLLPSCVKFYRPIYEEKLRFISEIY